MRDTFRILIHILCTIVLAMPALWISAQDSPEETARRDTDRKVVQFNGLGRANINNTNIGGPLLEGDTSTARRLTDGEFLLDLAINAQPGENAEIQGILRLRNEFGGFFGAGVSVEVRELWARGIIANAVKYRVGDFDMKMTPYTLFNADEEGVVNEPEAFRPFKDVIYYEQFYVGENTRRLQGANLEFGLTFPVVLDELNIMGFAARIRPTDFFTIPSRFVGGGSLDLGTRILQDSLGLRAKVGLNLAHIWDDLNAGGANSGIRNTVWSGDYDITILDMQKWSLHVLGEAGISSLITKDGDETVIDEDDTFMEAGISLGFKPARLTLTANYVDIGPDFFSMGAQSKRVDFNRTKSYFDRVTNNRTRRTPTLFDLGHDRALYTFQLSDRLMNYDPRLANVLPYGQATPNRRGLHAGLNYACDRVNASVTAAFLKEIRGQGTFELKDFVQLRGMLDFNLHKFIGWEKMLQLTLGVQYENTQRGGVEVEQVDFSSALAEIGIEAELFRRFDLLFGAKFLSAEGTEYVPLIEEYNDVVDFPAPYVVDDSEAWIAAGARYRFREGIFLSVQYERINYKSAIETGRDYDIGQFFVLYSMNF